MKRRIVSFTITSVFIFLLLTGQLFKIAANPQTVAQQSSTRVKELSSTRGMIFDRNLSPLVNDNLLYIHCVKPSSKSLSYFKNISDKENYNKLAEGKLLILSATDNQISELADSAITVNVYERYSNSSLLHISGYCDPEGKGVYGLEKYYDSFLKETGGTLRIAYNTDAMGRLMLGESIEIRSKNYYDQDGLVLTIDKRIQQITEKAMLNGNIDKGAAIVLDVKNASIVACSSMPLYDRDNLEKSINSPDAPFINRAFSAYPVGSVFKTVTAAAALENKVEIKNFICSGSIEKSGNIFNCNKTDGHGKLDSHTALSVSCNPFFIELGNNIGANTLLSFAKASGFGESIDLGNGFITDPGILPDENELNSEAAIGNFAFGQGKLTATPLQIATFFTTIANNGVMHSPYLIKGTTDKNGDFQPETQQKGIKILSDSTCEELKKALLKTTREGTGKTAFTSLFDSCTKTGTAQSGQYDENGKEILYCWFTGFFPYDDPRYVICILKENGSSGGADGGPVFKEISENIYINEIIE